MRPLLRRFLFHNKRLWARRAASALRRTWPHLAAGGEDILLETNPQNRARPQDDVSRASPNSLKLYIIYYIYYILHIILYSLYITVYILYFILYISVSNFIYYILI